jgi:hypothetical protein
LVRLFLLSLGLNAQDQKRQQKNAERQFQEMPHHSSSPGQEKSHAEKLQRGL